MKYNITSVHREQRFNFDNYYLDLIDDKGKELNYPVDFTAKYIHNEILGLGFPLEELNQEDIYQFILLFVIEATIVPKFSGDEFVANKFTNPVTLDNGKTWIKPIIGETYKVYRDGYRVLYDKPIYFRIEDERYDDLYEIVWGNNKKK